MKKLLIIFCLLTTFSTFCESPLILEGTYEFKKVIPDYTIWTYDVHGGSEKGKEKLAEYRADGFTCRHTFSLRYRCEKRVDDEIPADLEKKLRDQYKDYYIDFEPHDSFKKINNVEWRFQQVVIINDEIYSSYLYSESKFPYRLSFTGESERIFFDAYGRRDVRLPVKKSSKNAQSRSFLQLEKLTP
jgi:hypothetical protein